MLKLFRISLLIAAIACTSIKTKAAEWSIELLGEKKRGEVGTYHVTVHFSDHKVYDDEVNAQNKAEAKRIALPEVRKSIKELKEELKSDDKEDDS